MKRRTTFVVDDPRTTPCSSALQAAFDNDDLFAAPRQVPAVLTHSITCAVCALPAQIPIGTPGDLCGPCRTDLVMTRAHVEDVVGRARARLQGLIEGFERAVAVESEKDQGRWDAVIAARVKVQKGTFSAAQFQARWNEALERGDGLSRILAAHAPYEVGCQDAEQIEQWAARALEAIEAAGDL